MFPAELLSRFDIIGADPRGVGESRPAISCPAPPLDPEVTEFPSGRTGFDALGAHNRTVDAACRRATGPLLSMSTPSVRHRLWKRSGGHSISVQ
nr:alpha/beta fold hydrolase [Nocardia flavorosea]